MLRAFAGVAFAGVLALAPSCSYDEGQPKPPVEGACAEAPGPLFGCEHEIIETVEDACQKLLDCGAIDLDNPEGGGDYPGCLDFLSDLEDFQIDFALQCIESSTCDDLQVATCLEHGDS